MVARVTNAGTHTDAHAVGAVRRVIGETAVKSVTGGGARGFNVRRRYT